MKRIIKVITVILLTLIVSGCGSKTKVSYADFSEYFNKSKEYVMLDKTANFDLSVRKCVEAGDGKVQIFYMEFESEDAATKYVKDMYKKDMKYKINKDYTYVKKSKGMYFRLYRDGNVIVYGISQDKKNKKELKSKLKDLGY